MKTANSYAGKFIRVNLTNKQIKIEPTPEKLLREYLGGVGVGARLMWDETNAKTEPLSAENKLIFLTGPLQGTLFPQSARYEVVSRSPLTGWWAHASAGGFFGPELKFAGYDFVIIEGKSSKPVYLYIDNDVVQIRSAEHIWGKTVPETNLLIEKEVGDKQVKIACIGPAGENLVRYACIMSDYYRAVGRCGLGCIMGYKKLKAIAVRGTKGLSVADKDAFDKLFNDWIKRYTPEGRYWEHVSAMRTYGTFALTDWENAIGRLPTRNHWTGYFENAENTIGMQPLRKKHYKRHKSCFCCGIQCKYVSEIREGKYKGTESEGPEYETVEAFTSNFMSTDTNALIRANYLCNIYGLDTITTGHVISFAAECYENGILTKKDTNGRELRFVDKPENSTKVMETVLQLIEDIVYGKDDFSRLLQLGTKRAAEIIGRGAEKYAIHVNGLEASGQDPRPHKSLGLTYAINVRGADHLTSLSSLDELGYKEELLRRYDKKLVDILADRWDERYKGYLVSEMEEFYALVDSLLLCKYGTMWPPLYYFNDLLDIIPIFTGFEEYSDPKELEKLASRIVDLRRAFNIRLGWTKKNDDLHPRFKEEPIPTGPAKGQVCDLEPMLKEYYEIRKFDWETGLPSEDELIRVGLQDVAKELKKKNKVVKNPKIPKTGRKWVHWSKRIK